MINTYERTYAVVNIVIPMAGQGSRFADAGYEKQKPFIDVDGKAMIMRVLDNLSYPGANYILIAREEHLLKEPQLVEEIKSKYNVSILTIEKLTEGTAATILFAHYLINNSTPLLVANSDQIVDFDVSEMIIDAELRQLDGSILTFVEHKKDAKWSYAKIGPDDLVLEVREKEAISEFATVGLYYFSSGSQFVNAAIDMIVQNDRVNGEFYTCPVYNYMIVQKMKVGVFNISKSAMHGLGTPSDLNSFLGSLK